MTTKRTPEQQAAREANIVALIKERDELKQEVARLTDEVSRFKSGPCSPRMEADRGRSEGASRASAGDVPLVWGCGCVTVGGQVRDRCADHPAHGSVETHPNGWQLPAPVCRWCNATWSSAGVKVHAPGCPVQPVTLTVKDWLAEDGEKRVKLWGCECDRLGRGENDECIYDDPCPIEDAKV